MKMFQEIADKIFEEADVSKEGNMSVWTEVCEILSAKMATLSATEGLSMKRVEVFEKQKQTLVEDLLLLKKDGKLH